MKSIPEGRWTYNIQLRWQAVKIDMPTYARRVREGEIIWSASIQQTVNKGGWFASLCWSRYVGSAMNTLPPFTLLGGSQSTMEHVFAISCIWSFSMKALKKDAGLMQRKRRLHMSRKEDCVPYANSFSMHIQSVAWEKPKRNPFPLLCGVQWMHGANYFSSWEHVWLL